MVITVVVIAPCAALTLWGYTFTDGDEWWAWAWTIVAGLLTLLFVVANFGVLMESSKKSASNGSD